MKSTIFISLSFLLPPSFALAEYTCTATCIKAQRVTYYNQGPSYTILSRAIEVSTTERTKRGAWKVLRRRCDPYLLVTSYETAFEFGVGQIVKSHKEARKRTACHKETGDIRRPAPQFGNETSVTQ